MVIFDSYVSLPEGISKLEISSAGWTAEDLDEREIGGNLTWTEPGNLETISGWTCRRKTSNTAVLKEREKQNPTKTVMDYRISYFFFPVAKWQWQIPKLLRLQWQSPPRIGDQWHR
jgi:hypothetical protein